MQYLKGEVWNEPLGKGPTSTTRLWSTPSTFMIDVTSEPLNAILSSFAPWLLFDED